MRRALVPLAVLLAWSSPHRLGAQGADVPRAGSRVQLRIALPADHPLGNRRFLTGALDRLDDDSVVVVNQGRRWAVPRSAVTAVALSAGSRSRGAAALRGAGIGMLAGGAFGIAAGAVSDGGCGNAAAICLSPSEQIAFAGVGLGALGGIIGAAIGAGNGGEQWRWIALPPGSRVGLTVSPRRLALVARF